MKIMYPTIAKIRLAWEIRPSLRSERPSEISTAIMMRL